METGSPLTLILGICGILFLAVGLPLGIYFSYRQKGGPSIGEVLNRAGKGARRPWSAEDSTLAKLSDEVAPYKSNPGQDGPESPSSANRSGEEKDS